MLNKSLIINTALKRFKHFGIPKSTFNDIAKMINVKPGRIYQVFPEKSKLTFEVMNLLLRQYHNLMIRAVDPQKSLRDNLFKLICNFIRPIDQLTSERLHCILKDYFLLLKTKPIFKL